MPPSRLRNVPAPSQPGDDRGFRSLVFNKVLPLIAIAVAVAGILFWMLGEVDGEYLGASPELGRIRLSLDKDGNGLAGTLSFSDGTRLAVADGRMTSASSFELTFAAPKSRSDAAFMKAHHLSAWSNPTLIGRTDNGVLKATFQNGDRPIQLSLKRSPASVFFRRLWWQR